jgi:hypothetical protein
LRRWLLAIAGAWLIALGAATYVALRGQTDNAYLWLGILVLLAPIGSLFVVAALLPSGLGSWVWILGTALLWLVGGFGLLLIGFGLAIIPFQGYATSSPLVAYFFGFLVLIATLYLIGWRLARR